MRHSYVLPLNPPPKGDSYRALRLLIIYNHHYHLLTTPLLLVFSLAAWSGLTGSRRLLWYDLHGLLYR
jgi:hypothetical protein